MVGSAGNAPVRRFRLYFATPDLQSGSRITSQERWERGQESHLPLTVYEAVLCALVEFPAAKNWWSRRVARPHQPACKASLFCHGPVKIGKPSGCCPQQTEFWKLGCTTGARLVKISVLEFMRTGFEIAFRMEIGAAAGNCTRTISLQKDILLLIGSRKA